MTMKALTNLKSNLELLELIKDKRKPVMDAIEFTWMGTGALIELAKDYTKVDEMDMEARHDLIRELALRLAEEYYH